MLHDDTLTGFLNYAVRTTTDGYTVAEYPVDSHYRTDATSYDRYKSAKRLPYDLNYEREYADHLTAAGHDDLFDRVVNNFRTPAHVHDGTSCHYVHGRCNLND